MSYCHPIISKCKYQLIWSFQLAPLVGSIQSLTFSTSCKKKKSCQDCSQSCKDSYDLVLLLFIFARRRSLILLKFLWVLVHIMRQWMPGICNSLSTFQDMLDIYPDHTLPVTAPVWTDTSYFSFMVYFIIIFVAESFSLMVFDVCIAQWKCFLWIWNYGSAFTFTFSLHDGLLFSCRQTKIHNVGATLVGVDKFGNKYYENMNTQHG